MKTKKARRQEWIVLIENYKASGLTMAAWCSATTAARGSEKFGSVRSSASVVGVVTANLPSVYILIPA